MPEKSPISPFVKVLAAFFALLGICLLIGIAVFLFNLYQNDKEKEEMVDRTREYLLLHYKEEEIADIKAVSLNKGSGPPYSASVTFKDEPDKSYSYGEVEGYIDQTMWPFEDEIPQFKHLEPIELDLMYIVDGLEQKTREHLLKTYKEAEILSLEVPEGEGYIGYAYKCAVRFADEPDIAYNYIYLDGEMMQVSTTPDIQDKKRLKHLE